MQITRLLIENLRAVERLELQLADDVGQPRRRVVLIGANGAGKTTILDAVAHAVDALMGWNGIAEPGSKTLGAEDVRNIDDPSLEEGEPLRRGIVVLDAALSADEHRAGRRYYASVLAAGSLRFEIGSKAATDELVVDEDGVPQVGADDVDILAGLPDVDAFGLG